MPERGPSQRSRRWLVLTAVLGAVVFVVYVPWWGYLVVFGTEGNVPPSWRDPDVPADVEVVRVTTQCGSGGCSRQLAPRPPAGQSPHDLASRMSLEDADDQGWRWYDPHAVTVSSVARGSVLLVYIEYHGRL